MPRQGKSRRVAARQTQMGQRKKRLSPGPSGNPDIVAATPVRVDDDGPKPGTEKPAETFGSHPAEARRPNYARQAESRTTLYNYVRPELTRILGLATVIIATLIALTFVLR